MKPSAYLETSVVGAYLDNGEPFRRDLTIRWWEHELSQYRAVISPLVVRELERIEEPQEASRNPTWFGPEEARKILLGADYFIRLRVGSLPDDTVSNEYERTGLKWPE